MKRIDFLVMAKGKIRAAQVKQKHFCDLKRYKPGMYALGSQTQKKKRLEVAISIVKTFLCYKTDKEMILYNN